MKTLKFILFILSSMLFTTCAKRPFAHMEIHGRVVSAKTNQPLQARIELWVGSSAPGDDGTTLYGNTQTSGDGSFDIKSNAEWNGDNYSLLIIPDSINIYPAILKYYKITKHQNLDAGTIVL